MAAKKKGPTPKRDKWKDSFYREALAHRVGRKEYERLRLLHIKKVYG